VSSVITNALKPAAAPVTSNAGKEAIDRNFKTVQTQAAPTAATTTTPAIQILALRPVLRRAGFVLLAFLPRSFFIRLPHYDQ